MFKKILIASVAGIFVFAISTAAITATSWANQRIVLPKLDDSGFGRLPQRTKIFAADGTLLSTVYRENREPAGLDQVPDNLIKATLAIEDQRFYEHNGIDLRSIGRAIVKNAKSGSVVEGGSTITQQLVKNVFLTHDRTLDRKFREAVLAYQVENRYPKDKILEMYLNTVYYGNGAYGIKIAAESYFGKSSNDLTLEESALLAGLSKSPTRYSPYLNPEIAKKRRNTVLKQMRKKRYISSAEMETAAATELTLKPPQTESRPAAYFVEYVRRTLLEKYGRRKVYRGGLNVYTTIDLDLQARAEQVINETLNLPGDPSAALVAVDPKTGFIKAVVGGRDFAVDQFDLAVQGRRQAGSSFKTFVLVTALAQGMSPDKVFSGSSPIGIRVAPGQTWSVKNYGGKSMGAIPLREATVKSVNTVFAQVVMQVGAANVARTARRMGVTSPVDSLPAIALGGLSRGISPLDMASAYGTLANNGEHVAPTPIAKITKMDGSVVFEAKPEPTRALEPAVAAKANQVLQEVVIRGTGTAANIGRPVAGKTGTSENLADAWFVGYTPQLATSVWVGYPKSKVAMNSVHGIPVTGGSFPARIWQGFMSHAMRNLPAEGFAAPEGPGNGKVVVCTDMPFLATEACPTRKEIDARRVPPGTPPCPLHKPVARPRPRYVPRPAPQPAPAPEAAPQPAPQPEPAPQPAPAPEPAPQPEPAPAPEPAPQPEPAPEPAPPPPPPAQPPPAPGPAPAPGEPG